jgi:hypothetical protein
MIFVTFNKKTQEIAKSLAELWNATIKKDGDAFYVKNITETQKQKLENVEYFAKRGF